MSISLASSALLATAAPLSTPAPLPIATIAAQQEPVSVIAPDPIAESEEQAPEVVEQETQAGLPSEDSVDPSDETEASATDIDPEIIVSGESNSRQKDPLVQVNEAAFAVTQQVDKALVEPIAEVYEEDLPGPVRKGLRNFFRNLLEPVTALNYLLQLKPGKALETLGRFTVNSTIGVAGLFDVAKKEPFNLPYRRNGFGNTLGYYGVGPGPFLVLPLVGATSLRDLIGGGIDQAVLPLAVGKPFGTPLYAVPAYTVNSLEFRIEFDEKLDAINTSDDPYFAMRETYLCTREAEIAALKNRPPPRDCSIEALMGLTTPITGLAPEAGTASMASAAETQEGLPEVETEPASPAIIYVSEEVVQPLPADYQPQATVP